MSTQLTNNTLTLNNINYTGGTAGVILTTPTTVQTHSGSSNKVLPAVSVGSYTCFNGSVTSQSNSARTVKLPSSGRYFCYFVRDSGLTRLEYNIVSGGTTFLSSGTAYNNTESTNGFYIRVS